MNKLFNLGTNSGLPKYVALIALIQAIIVVIPESFWPPVDFASINRIINLPNFVIFYIKNTEFKNTMLLFWLCSPITFLINTYLFIIHSNFFGYKSYLQRRAIRLQALNKTTDYSLIAGSIAFIALFVWGTAFYLKDPTIFGDFVPTKSRVMMLIYAGAISLLMPVLVTLIVCETRANLSNNTIKG